MTAWAKVVVALERLGWQSRQCAVPYWGAWLSRGTELVYVRPDRTVWYDTTRRAVIMTADTHALSQSSLLG